MDVNKFVNFHYTYFGYPKVIAVNKECRQILSLTKINFYVQAIYFLTNQTKYNKNILLKKSIILHIYNPSIWSSDQCPQGQ